MATNGGEPAAMASGAAGNLRPDETRGGWRRNPGYCPAGARGKRVAVRLRCGDVCGDEPPSGDAKQGWAADGRGGCRWKLNGSWDRFDILEYRVL